MNISETEYQMLRADSNSLERIKNFTKKYNRSRGATAYSCVSSLEKKYLALKEEIKTLKK